MTWDESQHPRRRKGDRRGGEFAPKPGDLLPGRRTAPLNVTWTLENYPDLKDAAHAACAVMADAERKHRRLLDQRFAEHEEHLLDRCAREWDAARNERVREFRREAQQIGLDGDYSEFYAQTQANHNPPFGMSRQDYCQDAVAMFREYAGQDGRFRLLKGRSLLEDIADGQPAAAPLDVLGGFDLAQAPLEPAVRSLLCWDALVRLVASYAPVGELDWKPGLVVGASDRAECAWDGNGQRLLLNYLRVPEVEPGERSHYIFQRAIHELAHVAVGPEGQDNAQLLMMVGHLQEQTLPLLSLVEELGQALFGDMPEVAKPHPAPRGQTRLEMSLANLEGLACKST